MSRLEADDVLEGDHLEKRAGPIGDFHTVMQTDGPSAQYMIGYHVTGAADRFGFGGGQVGKVPTFFVHYVYIIEKVQVIAGHGD